MTRAAAVGLGLAVLLALVGCGKKGGEKAGGAPAAGVLAEVNDARVTDADLQRLVPPEFREGITGAEIRDILERWIRTELLFQKARQDGLDKDPQVAARLREMERDLLADEMLQHELGSRTRVSGAEVQAYYDAHRAEYTQELHLEQIVLNTREEAVDALQQLCGGASFEAVAQQRSIDASAAHGGDLGFVGKCAMNAEFEPHVFDLQVGEVMGPIASSFGFHVVKLVARRDALEPVPFDAARDEILHVLMLQKQQRAEAELLKSLRAAARVQVASTYAGMSLAADTTAAAAATSYPPVRSGGEDSEPPAPAPPGRKP